MLGGWGGGGFCRSAGRGGFWLPDTEANKAGATWGSPAPPRAGFPTPARRVDPGHPALFLSAGRILGSR